MVCFSVADPTSYERVRTKWVPEIRQHCARVPYILVGNKLDQREILGEVVDDDVLKSYGKEAFTKHQVSDTK